MKTPRTRTNPNSTTAASIRAHRLCRRLHEALSPVARQFHQALDAAITRSAARLHTLAVPATDLVKLRLHHHLTQRRLDLAEHQLDLRDAQATPAPTPPPPPRPDYTRDLTPEERTAILDTVDEIMGLDQPIRPPNGTVPPRTIFPADHMHRHPEWVAEEEAQRKALEAQGWYITPPLKHMRPTPNPNRDP